MKANSSLSFLRGLSRSVTIGHTVSQGYVKLFGSIIHSTIWRAENHVRLVWITMLAMVDKNGEVLASIPGLADAARVTIEECEEALLLFKSPDAYSRSKQNEGRRIADISGGWLILNHADYRARMSAEEKREKDAERKRRSRANQKPSSKERPENVPSGCDMSHFPSVSGSASDSGSGSEEGGAGGRPTNLAEALKLDPKTRAGFLERDENMAQWLCPQEWPEVAAVASAWGETRVGAYKRDSGVRAVVGCLADGFSLTELLRATARIKVSDWAKGKTLGMSCLSPEVVRRALNEQPAMSAGEAFRNG